MGFEIREVTGIANLIAQNEAIGRDHYDEIALNKRVMVYAPDAERFQRLEDSGHLLTLCVFDDGKVVGYSVNLISTHLHYRELVVCHNDMLYIVPEHRRGRLGLKLIRATQAAAKDRGAQLLTWHAKEHTTLADLLPKLGCGVQDILFSEVL